MEIASALCAIRPLVLANDIKTIYNNIKSMPEIYSITTLYISLEEEKPDATKIAAAHLRIEGPHSIDQVTLSMVSCAIKLGEEIALCVCTSIASVIPYPCIANLWNASMMTVLSEIVQLNKPIKGYELEHLYTSTFSVVLQYAFESKQNPTMIDQLIFKSRNKLSDEALEVIIKNSTDIKIIEVTRVLPHKELMLCQFQDSLLCAVELRRYMYIYECAREVKDRPIKLHSNIIYQIIENMRKDHKGIELYLYVCNVFIDSFNETTVEKFMDVIEYLFMGDSNALFMTSVGNFLKISVLVLELLSKIKSRMFSLYRCNHSTKEITALLIQILDSVDNEETMASLLFDKDLWERTTLDIICFNNFDSMMDHISIQSIASNLWNGIKAPGYAQQSQSFLLYSLSMNSYSEDFELEFRKLESRGKLRKPHRYNYSAWLNGMHLKYISQMAMQLILLLLCLIYINRIFQFSKAGHRYHVIMRDYQSKLPACSSLDICANYTAESKLNDHLASKEYSQLYSPFIALIAIFSLNVLVVFEHFIMAIHARLTNSKYWWNFYSLIDYFEASIALITFILFYFAIKEGDKLTDINERTTRIIKVATRYGGLEVYISINVSLIILKIIYMFRVNKVLGPFINSFNWVFVETMRFLVIFIFVLLLFGVVFSMIFYLDIEGSYKTISQTLLTLIPISFSNIDFSAMETNISATVFMMIFILIVSIIFINLMIGIAGLNYEKFQAESVQKIYLDSTKILMQYRDMHNLRASVNGIFPLNILCSIISFLSSAKNEKGSKQVDTLLLTFEYSIILVPIAIIYLLSEIILIIPAYIKITFTKAISIKFSRERAKSTYEFITYLLFGLLINIYYVAIDTIFFIADSIHSKDPSIEQTTQTGPFTISKSLLKKVSLCLREFKSKGMEYVHMSTMIKEVDKMLQIERKDKLKILQLFWCPSPKSVIKDSKMDAYTIKSYLLLISTLRSNTVTYQSRSYIDTASLYSLINAMIIYSKLSRCKDVLKKRDSAELTLVGLLESTRVVPEELINIKLLHHIKDCMITKGLQKYQKSKPSQKISDDLIHRIQTIK
jgi:hypothetical protein